MAINIIPKQKAPAIRNISKGAFWQRVTVAKRAELVSLAKTDILLEALLLTIADSEYINLDDQELKQGVNLCIPEVFSNEHFIAIFADGVDSEVPETLK